MQLAHAPLALLLLAAAAAPAAAVEVAVDARGRSAMRREEADASAQLFAGRLEDAQRGVAAGARAPTFQPKLRTCDAAKARVSFMKHHKARNESTAAQQYDAMLALAEVKRVFAELDLPIVLLSGVLLGWSRSCLAMPGDAGSDVGIFGPWLEEVGLDTIREAFSRQGHEFSASFCQDGPMRSGCEMRVQLPGLSRKEHGEGTPSVDIFVLFSPPPLGIGQFPGFFDQCHQETCGQNCERCNLATALWSGQEREQGRFFACPLPLRSFELASWMKETFWVPQNEDQYLKDEYGPNWRELQPTATHEACKSYTSRDISLSPYQSYIPGLPNAKAVMAAQRELERNEAARIAHSATEELQLWRLALPEVMSKDSTAAPWEEQRAPPIFPWQPGFKSWWRDRLQQYLRIRI
eukprot:gb/GFBE01011751.1/.p1 GENE.gb/GFBE01011751.1/~~gb/GFBE01011751.1/.p1  ORF type:complete len:408 (+),score=69.03 gb/GFBE01011751.1/:1-1224(+)